MNINVKEKLNLQKERLKNLKGRGFSIVIVMCTAITSGILIFLLYFLINAAKQPQVIEFTEQDRIQLLQITPTQNVNPTDLNQVLTPQP